jgi:hypothetical protein
MKIKRVFHHWEKCEEYKTNMWRQVPACEREGYMLRARALMIDAENFKDAMLRAVSEWPVSCEANLTASSMNHQAWMGHAGCAITINSPEDVTRLAWRTLNKEQQDKANAAADHAIATWKQKYIMEKADA